MGARPLLSKFFTIGTTLPAQKDAGCAVTATDKEDKKNKAAVRIIKYTIDKLSRSYSEAGKNAPLALIDSFGFLEISVNQGNARNYFSVQKGTAVEVEIEKE